MLQLRKPFYRLDLASAFRKSEVVLAKNVAPSFEKEPDRLSKPAAINTVVFF